MPRERSAPAAPSITESPIAKTPSTWAGAGGGAGIAGRGAVGTGRGAVVDVLVVELLVVASGVVVVSGRTLRSRTERASLSARALEHAPSAVIASAASRAVTALDREGRAGRADGACGCGAPMSACEATGPLRPPTVSRHLAVWTKG